MLIEVGFGVVFLVLRATYAMSALAFQFQMELMFKYCGDVSWNAPYPPSAE